MANVYVEIIHLKKNIVMSNSGLIILIFILRLQTAFKVFSAQEQFWKILSLSSQFQFQTFLVFKFSLRDL